MISVIFPFWERQEALDKSLSLMGNNYPGLDMEVVIVDDGSPTPCVLSRKYPWPVHIIRLPSKTVAKNPCVPINTGVRASKGSVIVLTNPEVIHELPVLPKMLKELEDRGPNAYVLASVWCPEERRWHCKSGMEGLHFCTMLNRELFDRAGGFDEDYRDGAGYDDNDFVRRLHKAGAEFVFRDDLVVIHPKTGARTTWPDGSFPRNRALYDSKWQNPVSFVCLKAGDFYGPEYVNILLDMIVRNTHEGVPINFYCLTDNYVGLDPRIKILPLPGNLEKWWGKLYLFKRNLFPDGARVVFFDLDTLIVGGLEEIVAYKGQFATLKDFYKPDRVGPAVMLWEAGAFTSSIWDDWVAQGRPRNPWGDLWWINGLDQGRFARRCDKLQDLYPGAFVSYKAHCHPYPPKGAKVVCFHGEPRPANCGVQWVKDAWRIGGGGMADMEIVANTEAAKVMENVKKACARGLPELDLLPEHAGRAVLVGGGPSVSANIEEIRALQASGATVVALNGSARFLKRHGILADWQVIVDSRPQNAAFVVPEVPRHFVCSQCDPSVFDAAQNATVFHVNTEATLNAVGGGQHHLISTGSTVGLIAMGIAHTQGFRVMGLYGYDSSYSEAGHHAYEQKLNDDDRVVEAVAGGRTFRAAPWMVAQVNQFQELATQLANDGCTITVAGDGLLPHVARLMSQQEITT